MVVTSRLRSIGDLPAVLISEILCRLPVEDIIRCRCVCQTWCKLSKETHFINNHKFIGTQHLLLQADLQTKEGKINKNALFLIMKRNCDADDTWMAKKIEIPQDLCVKASCNGLLLLFPPTESSPIYLYNPITKNHLELPKRCQAFKEARREEFTVGFGFDPVKKQYKVVIEYKMFSQFHSYGEILTIGETAWRKLHFPYRVSATSSQPFSNGAFHSVISMGSMNYRGHAILALDITSEKFEIIKFPPPTGNQIQPSLADTNLMCLGSSLALIWLNSYGVSSRQRLIELPQIFDTESDHRWVYTYNFSLCLQDRNVNCETLGMLSDGCFLTRAWDPYYQSPFKINIFHPCIALYNPKNKESQILHLPELPISSQAFSFIPSLVSPSAFNSKFDAI